MAEFTSPGLRSIDRETYLTAVEVLEQYGERATQFAAKQSTKHEHQEDMLGSRHWDRVIVAILELERTWLRKDEMCN
jgi:hypothetical protein